MTCGIMDNTKLILVLPFVAFTAVTFIDPAYRSSISCIAGTILVCKKIIRYQIEKQKINN